MKVQVERVVQKEDQRGSVWEPITDSELRTQGNCHVVITQPGGVRGNHYHKVGTEIASQCGPALVTYKDELGLHEVEVKPGETVRFVFPPGIPHAFQNNGKEPNLLVAFNTEVFNPDNPDVVREDVTAR